MAKNVRQYFEHDNHNTTDEIKTIETVNTYNMLEVKRSHQTSGMEQGQKCLISDYQLDMSNRGLLFH
jgi:hypothetical protein